MPGYLVSISGFAPLRETAQGDLVVRKPSALREGVQPGLDGPGQAADEGVVAHAAKRGGQAPKRAARCAALSVGLPMRAPRRRGSKSS